MVRLSLDRRLLAAPLPGSIEVTQEGSLLVLQLPHGDSVQHTLARHEVKLTQPVIAVINQQTADFAHILEDGDRIRLLPQIAGG
jgi:sulfur carrier protein ThiS